jgi:hypothetical protein
MRPVGLALIRSAVLCMAFSVVCKCFAAEVLCLGSVAASPCCRVGHHATAVQGLRSASQLSSLAQLCEMLSNRSFLVSKQQICQQLLAAMQLCQNHPKH